MENEENCKNTENVKHRIIFTLNSGSKPWAMSEVERDSIDESELLAWTKDCVLHHTGKALTKREWQLFNANGELRRNCGNLTHVFSFSRYSIG